MPTIRIMPGARACHFKGPVLSEGGICLREEYCVFPLGHAGPHRTPSGGTFANHERFMADIMREPGRKR